MYEVKAQVLTSAHTDGAIVVDVREPSEYATGHVPGARLIPAHEIRTRLYELPRRSTLYVVCANGARSLDLIPFLRAVGYDAYSVAGGMWAWQNVAGSQQDGDSSHTGEDAP
ncbi:rhodanese-like domain-containing protein [Nocardioides sp.]|uniref:rhodanese-like domain-containing protein n=1 Tax=Nocardioides sp. TaxID=35761 RepID=UPI003D0FFEDD